jgi:4-hydroxy-tetrahydrodipicolinate reductase
MQDTSTKIIRVAVAGAAGRMGSETVRAVDAAPDMDVVTRINRGDDLDQVMSKFWSIFRSRKA